MPPLLPDIAATFDHKFYRRGVRIRNGTQPPGTYNSSNPALTRGLTIASENGIYVQGNFNATGISSVGTPTASNLYLPQNTSNHIPTSIVGDSITILSNNWNDGQSFVYPFNLSKRSATRDDDEVRDDVGRHGNVAQRHAQSRRRRPVG